MTKTITLFSKIIALVIVLLISTACNGNGSSTYAKISPSLLQGTYAKLPINSDEMVTIRLYYHCSQLDPNMYGLPEAFLYNTRSIYTSNLHEEFIEIMYEHIGIHIQAFWFEGDKLYVNLHEDSRYFFDQHGTTGALEMLNIFERTLLSLPGAISSFEVLVDGQRGVEGSHFSFNHIAIVEDGRVVAREWLCYSKHNE